MTIREFRKPPALFAAVARILQSRWTVGTCAVCVLAGYWLSW